MEIGFSYGVFSDTLEIQANKQGFTLGDKADFLEELRHSVSLCKFHLATDLQAEQMIKKLQKKVVAELKPLGGNKNNE